MKKILTLFALIAATVQAGAQGWFRQPTPNDTLQSVRVLPDGKVLFQIYAPKARTVAVTGDLPWDKPVIFKEAPNGVWKGICEGLADGCFRYSFYVDGTKVQDPKAPLSAEQASIFTKGPGYIKDVPHGAVAQRYYWSKNLNEMRRMHVWTPAGYEKSAKKLPVLYLIHGGGDNDASWPGVGAAGWILDNLLAEGKMVPMIVVMPNGTVTGVPNEVPPFAEDMMENIIPFVEANYNVYTDAKHRAVAGLSMGGFHTLYLSINYPELFGYSGMFSAAIGVNDPSVSPMYQDFDAKLAKYYAGKPALLWIGCGVTDFLYQANKDFMKKLDDNGFKYTYMETDGGHIWKNWRIYLTEYVPLCFK